MGVTYADDGSGRSSVPQTKNLIIYSIDANLMNSSGKSFLTDGDEFVSFDGAGSSNQQAGFPLVVPDDFVSIQEIIINHTTAATVNTVNYKIDVNKNVGNYLAVGETLTYPARAGSAVSWDILTDTQTPSSTTFLPGEDYTLRIHRDATLDTYTGSSFVREIIFKYSTI